MCWENTVLFFCGSSVCSWGTCRDMNCTTVPFSPCMCTNIHPPRSSGSASNGGEHLLAFLPCNVIPVPPHSCSLVDFSCKFQVIFDLLFSSCPNMHSFHCACFLIFGTLSPCSQIPNESMSCLLIILHTALVLAQGMMLTSSDLVLRKAWQ